MGCPGPASPCASIDDGLLDICILRGKGGLSQISLFTIGALLQRSDLISDVVYYRVHEATISSQSPLYVHSDGDFLGPTPMVFESVPRALRVLVPQEVPL